MSRERGCWPDAEKCLKSAIVEIVRSELRLPRHFRRGGARQPMCRTELGYLPRKVRRRLRMQRDRLDQRLHVDGGRPSASVRHHVRGDMLLEYFLRRNGT